MKKTTVLWMLAFLFLTFGFYACEKDFFQENVVERGKGNGGGGGGGGGGGPKKGELYGDLYEIQFYQAGVPVFGRLPIYDIEEDEEPHALEDELFAHVNNIRLHGNGVDGEQSIFTFIPDRNSDGTPRILEEGEEPEICIKLDENGYIVEEYEDGEVFPINSFLQFYNLEGEILEIVADYAYPLEFGRLNLVRSPDEVKERRMTEVIANFGNGTVAEVIRDYCGRLFMVQVDDNDPETPEPQGKPIDSPLENLAVYYELMTRGVSASWVDDGLKFLVAEDLDAEDKGGTFNFMMRQDYNWGLEPSLFTPPVIENETTCLYTNDQLNYVANLAAAGLAAGSDKFGKVSLQEVVFVNQALGIPEASIIFPVLTIKIQNVFGGEVNSMTLSYILYDVDDGLNEIKEAFGMDNVKVEIVTEERTNSAFLFQYNRLKFENTYFRYTSDPISGTYGNQEDLHDILLGAWPDYFVVDTERYNSKTTREGAFGFANQADDYVQALVFGHDYELMLQWAMPTPTWDEWLEGEKSWSDTSPFDPNISHEEGGGGGSGNGGGGGHN